MKSAWEAFGRLVAGRTKERGEQVEAEAQEAVEFAKELDKKKAQYEEDGFQLPVQVTLAEWTLRAMWAIVSELEHVSGQSGIFDFG